jgi:hypothetical protein
MTQRWQKPPKTQQLGLALPRGKFTPAGRDTTDTSSHAAASIGLKRGGGKDAMENIGDLANAMVGAMERQTGRQTRRKRLADVMFAVTVRKEVLDYLCEHPEGATADEIATAIHRSFFTVRPRLTELGPRHMKLIEDSGTRRANASSGRAAIVWRVKVTDGDL